MDHQASYGCRRCSNGHNLCSLSPGQASDAVAGREPLGGSGPLPAPLPLLRDRAYEDHETLPLALNVGFLPVVPPRSNRLQPWQYDKPMYRKRSEIGSSADAKASAASSRASINSMSSFWLSVNFALIVEALR